MQHGDKYDDCSGGFKKEGGCISKMVKILHKMHHFCLKCPKIFWGGGKVPSPHPPTLPLSKFWIRRWMIVLTASIRKNSEAFLIILSQFLSEV